MSGELASRKEVRADFDRIAGLPAPAWDHNRHYHAFLLSQLPANCGEALEIGCGRGEFSRLLAGRAAHVTALDLSPNMIRAAKELSTGFANLDFQVADATTWEFPPGRYGCIASLATFHHLSMEAMLSKIRTGLKRGGRLIVLDLYKAQGLADLSVSLVAVPANLLLKLVRSGRLRELAASRQAWAEHGRRDVYLTLAEVRRLCAGLLPGARLRRHLFWRYSLIWEREYD